MRFVCTYNRILVLLLVGSLYLSLVSNAFAQTTNEQITFYGTLQDSSGNDLDGVYDMVFRFYNAPTGGTQLDINTHTAANGNPVIVSEGEFAAVLGSGAGNTLDGLNFNTGVIYVGVSIEGEAEVSPRTRLGAAAYAINADKLDGCDAPCYFRNNATGTVATSSSDTLLTIRQNGAGDILNIRDGATEVLTIVDGGYVGIGTSSPSRTVTVDGSFQLTGSFVDSARATGTNGHLITSTGAGTNWVATSTFGGGPGAELFTDAGDYTYLTDVNSLLGIGTTTASQRLTLASGNLNLTSNGAVYMDDLRMMLGSSTGSFGFGYQAGAVQNTGLHNLSFGSQSGSRLPGSLNNYNISMGLFASTYASNVEYSTFIGRTAGLYANNTDHSFYLGRNSGYAASGNYNFAFGEDSMSFSEGSYSVAIGYATDNNGGGGDANVILGSLSAAGYFGDNSILLGDSAGNNTEWNGEANHLIASGYYSAVNSSGNHNIVFGYYAGRANGYDGYGDGNIVFGRETFEWTNSGEYNVGIGYNIGNELEASSSVIIGLSSFSSAGDPVATHNTSLGANNFSSVNDGDSSNILLGPNVNTSGSLSNSIFIGDNIRTATAGSGRLSLGNLIFGTGATSTGTNIPTNGRVGIGANTPTAQLHTTGTVRLSNFGAGTLQTDASGNVSVSSDERLKEIETFYTDSIDALMGIEPIVFKWNEASGFETLTEYIGFSAQNVKDNIPGAVGEDGRGFLTLSDRGILATVVNAVKELFGRTTAIASSTDRIARDVEKLANDSEVQKSWSVHLEERIEILEDELDIEFVLSEEALNATSAPTVVESISTSTTATSSTSTVLEIVDETASRTDDVPAETSDIEVTTSRADDVPEETSDIEETSATSSEPANSETS